MNPATRGILRRQLQHKTTLPTGLAPAELEAAPRRLLFSSSGACRGFPDLLLQALVRVAHTLIFVRIRGAQRPDLGRHLADLMLVRPLYYYVRHLLCGDGQPG